MSTTTFASTARRPCLLSKTTPFTVRSSAMTAAAQLWSNRRTAQLLHELERDELEPLRIDHRRPGHRVPEGAETLSPVSNGLGVGRSPQLARRAGDGVGREAIEDLLAEAGDDLGAGPVRHPVDPDDEPAGRKAAEMVVALDEGYPGTHAARRGGRGASRRSSADDEHVGLVVHRDLAGRLTHRAEGEIGERSCRLGRAVLDVPLITTSEPARLVLVSHRSRPLTGVTRIHPIVQASVAVKAPTEKIIAIRRDRRKGPPAIEGGPGRAVPQVKVDATQWLP